MSSENDDFTQEDDLVLNQLMIKKTLSLQKQIDELRIQRSVKDAEINNRLDTQDKNINHVINFIDERAKKDDYFKAKIDKTHVNLQQLGTHHQPVVGRKYMGELLRRVGVANKTGYTNPKSNFTSGTDPLCLIDYGSGYPNWTWHSERTWELIQERLTRMGYFTKFNCLKSKDDIHKFINELSFYDDMSKAGNQ